MSKKRLQMQKRDPRDQTIAELEAETLNVIVAPTPDNLPHVLYTEQQIARAQMEARRDVLEHLRPVLATLNDIEIIGGNAAQLAALTHLRDRRVLDVIREQARTLAAELSKQVTYYDILMREMGTVPDNVPELQAFIEDVSTLQQALRDFASGTDDGEALRAYDHRRGTIIEYLMHALANIEQGGAPVNQGKRWLGEHIAREKETTGDTYAEITRRIYTNLITREQEGSLLPAEREALAELDTRAGHTFREKGLLPQTAVNYASQAARDYRKNKKTVLLANGRSNSP